MTFCSRDLDRLFMLHFQTNSSIHSFLRLPQLKTVGKDFLIRANRIISAMLVWLGKYYLKQFSICFLSSWIIEMHQSIFFSFDVRSNTVSVKESITGKIIDIGWSFKTMINTNFDFQISRTLCYIRSNWWWK